MTGITPDSNSNVGRNTGDPSGMQHPNEDGGALPPSSGEDPSGKGGWIAFWIVIALLALGGLVWWLVSSNDGASPAGIPSASAPVSESPSASTTPSATPSTTPSATPSPTSAPEAGGGEELASGDFSPAWPSPVPAFEGDLAPLGTGWDYFYQYAASLVSPQCGDNFDAGALDNTGMVQLDGAVQNSVSGPDATFAFASRMTNTSDEDLAGTVWSGPEVMLVDANGKIVSITRVETAPITSPEFGDTPPGSFGPGDSIEVYGQHGPIRQCLANSDDFANDPPNPEWAPLDSQAVLAPGTYDAVIRVSQPTGDVLGGGDADAGTDSQELLYTELGTVTIGE